MYDEMADGMEPETAPLAVFTLLFSLNFLFSKFIPHMLGGMCNHKNIRDSCFRIWNQGNSTKKQKAPPARRQQASSTKGPHRQLSWVKCRGRDSLVQLSSASTQFCFPEIAARVYLTLTHSLSEAPAAWAQAERNKMTEAR